MTARRLPGWEARFAAAIDEASARRFSWGQFDCCLFACDVVVALRGIDPAAWFRGRYTTRREAFRLLREFAGGGISETWERLAREFGFPAVPIACANRGDVALISTPRGDALGVVIGSAAIAPGPHGIVRAQRAAMQTAWAI